LKRLFNLFDQVTEEQSKLNDLQTIIAIKDSTLSELESHAAKQLENAQLILEEKDARVQELAKVCLLSHLLFFRSCSNLLFTGIPSMPRSIRTITVTHNLLNLRSRVCKRRIIELCE
jgi:hypothetical protein